MSSPSPNGRTIVRFAPSPNGLLHLGHVRSAMENWQAARQEAGAFLLRIEDIDTDRCRPEFEAAIFEDLHWLGLKWREPIRRQSQHFSDYQEALTRLQRMGLVYPAFLSRGESARLVSDAEAGGRDWPRDPDGAAHYPGTERAMATAERERRMEAGTPFAWRLDMQAACSALKAPLSWIETGLASEASSVNADPAAWGDVVIARRDLPTSYHLSVTVDDHMQGITRVIRGRDLFHATSVHRLLQTLLGYEAPTYHHHELVVDSAGRKLSKSDGDTAIASLRANGLSAFEVTALAFAGQPAA